MELTKTDKINKYHNGKIYTIRSYQTDKFYIGSTCSPLHKRFYGHKNDYAQFQNQKYHYITSFEIIKYDDCYIELLELFKCDYKIELRKREGEWIRANKINVVNKCVAGRSIEQYQIDNKQIISEYKNKKNNCECGGNFITVHKSRHLKTKKHLKYMDTINKV